MNAWDQNMLSNVHSREVTTSQRFTLLLYIHANENEWVSQTMSTIQRYPIFIFNLAKSNLYIQSEGHMSTLGTGARALVMPTIFCSDDTLLVALVNW